MTAPCRRLAVSLLLVLACGGPLVWAGDDGPPGTGAELRVYLAPGMSAGEVARAVDDDLGSGLAGAVPEVLLHALTELRPGQFGSSLGEAYRRYGWLFLEGRPDLPVGMTRVRTLGVAAHQFNCLACHAGQGVLPGERDLLVIGATNRGIDFTAFFRDVFGALGELARAERERAVDAGATELALRFGARLVGAARRGARREAGRCLTPSEVALLGLLAQRFAEAAVVDAGDPGDEVGEDDDEGARRRVGPDYGSGRTVVLEAYRQLRFELPAGPYAPVKPPDLFGVPYRRTLLWTGNEVYPPEQGPAERIARNGMLVPWIQVHPVTRRPVPDLLTGLRFPRYLRMGEVLAKAAPPPAPAPRTPAAEARLRRGQALFAESCQRCHGSYRFEEALTPDGRPGLRAEVVEYPEEVLPVDEVGTDATYTESVDRAFVEALRGSYLGRAGLFEMRATRGYVARPLLGLRLRAPYLHNGSVPSLRWLLTPPAERPARFRVGPGVAFDAEAVGLRHPASASPTAGAVRDTTRPGEGAFGHPFGTELGAADKAALLEFLQRL